MIEVIGLKEWCPFLDVDRLYGGHCSAFFHNVRTKWPPPIQTILVVMDDHQAGPVQIAIVEEELLLVHWLRLVPISFIRLAAQQGLFLLTLFLALGPEKVGPQVSDLP